MGGVWSGEEVESEGVGGDVTSVKWVILTTITQLMNSDLFPCRPSLLYTDLVPNAYLV